MAQHLSLLEPEKDCHSERLSEGGLDVVMVESLELWKGPGTDLQKAWHLVVLKGPLKGPLKVPLRGPLKVPLRGPSRGPLRVSAMVNDLVLCWAL